ncbi:MAG TPA: hypothetical protein VFC75_02560 [Erysipelothrix sp.]|nr:hypothetical protein [Erysipelothrix sp.]
MKIYNTRRLTQNQRFTSAVIFGTLGAIVLGALSGYLRIVISSTTGFEFSIVTVGATYLLALLIQKVGRGVQVRFSVLGGVLGFILVSISNVISFGYPLFQIFNPLAHFTIIMYLVSGNINTLLMLVYQGIAIYVAYTNSRFI